MCSCLGFRQLYVSLHWVAHYASDGTVWNPTKVTVLQAPPKCRLCKPHICAETLLLLLAERLSCKPDLHSEIELVAVHSANSMAVAFMSGEDDQPTVR